MLLAALLLAAQAPCPDLSKPFRTEDRSAWGLWPGFPMSIDTQRPLLRRPEGPPPNGWVPLAFDVETQGVYRIAIGEPGGVFEMSRLTLSADRIHYTRVPVPLLSEERSDCPGIERILSYRLTPEVYYYFTGSQLPMPRLSIMMIDDRPRP